MPAASTITSSIATSMVSRWNKSSLSQAVENHVNSIQAHQTGTKSAPKCQSPRMVGIAVQSIGERGHRSHEDQVEEQFEPCRPAIFDVEVPHRGGQHPARRGHGSTLPGRLLLEEVLPVRMVQA